MVQLTDVEWAEIQRKLNPPTRERLSGVEVADVYEQARMSGPRPGQLFRHKKSGGVYQVMTVALMEATLEPVVVYHPLFPNPNGICPVFTRPLSEWREKFVDASGPGKDDPAENGVNPRADHLASPAREAEPIELPEDADGAPLPNIEMIAKAFSQTIFWNYLNDWPGDADKEPESPLEVYDRTPADADPHDLRRVALRFELGECDITVAEMFPVADGRDPEGGTTQADVEFVAKLPVYVPILLAEIDRLRAKMVGADVLARKEAAAE